MALYITPLGRAVRSRRWARPENEEYRENGWNETGYDVFIPVNVKAGADAYEISALLPGVKADDLSIQVVNETVTLQGEIKDSVDEKESYLLRERPTGRFVRVIRLPEPLDSSNASADLTDGVLTLRVPKAEEARPRTIKVNAN